MRSRTFSPSTFTHLMDTFRTEVTQMRPDLLRVAHRRLRNSAWAEDAVSETLLVALQKRPEFNAPGRVRPWLFGILRHKVVDQLREHLGAKGEMIFCDDVDNALSSASDACPRSDPMHHLADRQFITALQGQLQRMPQMHAEAFVMRECQGDGTQEICDKLAITAGHLFVVLHRTRSRLRQNLSAHRG